MDCACRSTNNLIGGGFSAIVELTKRGLVNAPGRGPKMTNRTVLSKFRSQLNTIIETIRSTRTRYIRCIKPNTEMLPRVTDHMETMNQLESSGLITAITISRETFPKKLNYVFLWNRFRCLSHQKSKNCTALLQSKISDPHSSVSTHSSTEKVTLKKNVEELLSRVLVIKYTRSDGVSVPSYACGKTQVYFRPGAHERLETDRIEYYSLRVTKIKSWYRCQVLRLKYHRLRHAVGIVQSRRRGKIAFTRYIKVRNATVIVQTRGRGKTCKLNYVKMRHAVIAIQAECRRKVARSRHLEIQYAHIALQSHIKDAVLIIQKRIRGKYALDRYCLLKQAAIVVQRRRRGKVSHSKYCEIRYAVITSVLLLQKMIRGAAVRSHFLVLKHSCVIIQAWLRGGIELRKFNLQRQSLIRTFQSRSQIGAAVDDFDQIKKPSIGIHETFRNIGSRLNTQELAKIKQHIVTLREEVEELEEDKSGLIYHAQTIEAGVNMARKHSEQLLKANASLVAEISELRHEHARLGKELVLVREKGDENILSMSQHFRQLISQRDSEICQLEETTRNRPISREVEVSRLSDRMDHQREGHLMEVNLLKAKLQKTQDSHHSYWEKLTDVLETSHFTREAEVEQLSGILKCLENEKDAEIRKLKADIASMRTTGHKRNNSTLSIDSRTKNNTRN